MDKTVRLHGGSRDGETCVVSNIQHTVYVPKRITLEESKRLQISANLAWRWPEDVYEINERGEYVFRNTVNYNPEEIK